MPEPTSIVPDKAIRPGFNETGTAIGANLAVARVAGGDVDSIALPAAAGGVAFGVTLKAIGDDERGDVQIEGQVIVTAGGTITRGAELQVLTNGRVDVAATGDNAVGRARSAGGDGDLIEAEWYPAAAGRVVP